jgi:hypothetical protein
MTKYAEITFTVDDVEYRLAPPTPRLAFQLDRRYGGTVPLYDRINAGDKNVYAELLRLLCGAVPKSEEALQAFVYHNLLVVQIAVRRWCLCLENGGEEPKQAAEESGEPAAGNGAAVPEAGESL